MFVLSGTQHGYTISQPEGDTVESKGSQWKALAWYAMDNIASDWQ